MYPKYYHIRCLKTGTTSLQKVLDDDKRINVIRSRYFNTNKYYYDDYNYFKKNQVNIESDENIILNYDVFSGLYTSLKRIKDANEEAEIIVTIRKQRDLIISGFKHHVISSGECSTNLEEFINSSRGISYLNMCDYEQVYRIINKFFERDKINFIMFEDLKNDYLNFYKKIYSILGIQVPKNISNVRANTSRKDSEVLLIAKSNKNQMIKSDFLLNKIENKIHRLIIKGIKPLLKEKTISWGNGFLFKQLENKFRKNNNEFMKLSGLNLKKYDYLF
jgi:hypothetical protein